MYEVDDTVHVDIKGFAAHMAEIRIDTLYAEQYEAEVEEYYSALNDNLKQGLYNAAFECAQALRSLDFSKYMDTVISCYKKCAENDMVDAMLELVRFYIDRRSLTLKAEAFPYLKRLSELGYIESFRLLADYYYYGIGCEKDLIKASHSYFEAVLFDFDGYSREQLRNIYAHREWPDDTISRLIKMDVLYMENWWHARTKIAELILNGKIKEYAPETAVYLMRKLRSDEIGGYILGECLLNGIGTDVNPVIARYILEEVKLDIEFGVEESEGSPYENYDYDQAYDRVTELLVDAEHKVQELQEKNDYIDEEQIINDWENEKITTIKRKQ
ncbi:MAG: sel1 repeat family protein [Butyrivibrio sp.]|nr:sel1 repeat family protein [Butyrivibrio sp.]